MTNRIIEIADRGAYIHLENSLLVLERNEGGEHTIPLEEVGVLLLSHSAVTMTSAVICGIIEAGGMVVLCDQRYLPAGLFLPYGSHTSAARNYEAQVSANEPLKKQIWKEIIRKKVLFQGELLFSLYQDDSGLKGYSNTVASGDTKNVEGMAARVYWSKLFNYPFKRDQEAMDQNRYLNYGYTLLRSCTARAICSSGLHPSFGLHHHNQYNPFRLADDLMEPFRPLVDRKVVELLYNFSTHEEFTKDIKRKLLEIFLEPVFLKKQKINLFDALTLCASSLLKIYEKKSKNIILPEHLISDLD